MRLHIEIWSDLLLICKKNFYSRFNFKMNTVIVTVNKYQLKGAHTHTHTQTHTERERDIYSRYIVTLINYVY